MRFQSSTLPAIPTPPTDDGTLISSTRTTSPLRPRRSRQGGRAIPALIAVVAVTAVIAVWGVRKLNSSTSTAASSSAPASTAAAWYDVSRKRFDITIVAGGELDAKRKVEIKSAVEGAATITEIVPEGSAVKTGDVLVRLASDEIKEKLEQETLNVEKAIADQVAAEQELAIKQNESESNLKDAKLKVTLAELELSKWEKGSDPQQKRDLSLKLEKARRTLVRATRDRELSKQLYDEKFISLGEKEDSEIAEIEAINALASAELDEKVYNEFTRPKEEKKVRADVDQARAELDRTQRKNASELARVQADLHSKVATLKIRQQRLDKLKEQLAAATITAPQDGLVVYASSVGPAWRRTQPITQGRQVRLNDTIIILPDTRQMIAVLKVNEALVGQVQVQQKVSLTIDSRPTKPIEGTIFQIGVMAEDGGWMNPDLREYLVRVDMPGETDASLKPAMRCSGQIVVGQVENAIAVPVQAVVSEGKTRFVYVPGSNGKVEKREVEIGKASESLVEIRKGLDEGDRVLLRRPRAGEVADKG